MGPESNHKSCSHTEQSRTFRSPRCEVSIGFLWIFCFGHADRTVDPPERGTALSRHQVSGSCREIRIATWMELGPLRRAATCGSAACCAERLRLSVARAFRRTSSGWFPSSIRNWLAPWGQRLVDEFSPRGGRHSVAHGESRGYVSAPSPPPPLPRAGEGCHRRGEGALPRACALGHTMSPLSGLASVPSPPLTPITHHPLNPLLSRGGELFS